MGFHHRAVRHDLGLGLGPKATGAQEGARRQADKAVAAKALTTHHGFQQKAVLAIALGVGQLQIEREWGFEVGKRLGHQRNAVVALAGQAFEFKFCNHRAGFPGWGNALRRHRVWQALRFIQTVRSSGGRGCAPILAGAIKRSWQ